MSMLQLQASEDEQRVPNGLFSFAADDPLALARRLDHVQQQIDEVNRLLAVYLEQKRRRRRAIPNEWLRFTRRARQLAHYAPS